jgi:hypothetical protein
MCVYVCSSINYIRGSHINHRRTSILSTIGMSPFSMLNVLCIISVIVATCKFMNLINFISQQVKEHGAPCVALVIKDNPYGLTFAFIELHL